MGPTALSRIIARSSAASPSDLLTLQRIGGNRNLIRLLRRRRTLSAGDLSAELQADGPGAEAIRQADSAPLALSRDAVAGSSAIGPGVEQRLAERAGGGHPLPVDARRQMESRFNTDFGSVRVHTDGEAAQLSRNLSAEAFTHGSDIYFGAGKFQPGTAGGKHLLAHELTHTIQQASGSVDRTPSPSNRSLIQRRLVTFGTVPDVNAFLGLMGPPAGLTLALNVATNQVQIAAVLPAAPASPTLRARLTAIINDARQHAEVIIARGQPQVLVGAFPQPSDLTVTRVQQIDIDDILAIEAGAPNSGVAVAIHEIEENFQAHGLTPVAGRDRFRQTHERAVRTESAVAIELIGPGGRVAEVIVATPTAADPTAQTVVFDYETYYLVFTTTFNAATQDRSITGSRRTAKVAVSARTIDNYPNGGTTVPGAGAATIGAAAADVAANPTGTVLIEGFADSSGSNAANVTTSRRRAERARDALVAAGVGRNQIHIIGRGETNFVAPNDTPANRALNRRVVITVTRP